MIQAAYIHIPFCEHICHYCDFNKVFLKGQPVDEYLDALEKEIQMTTIQSPVNKLDTIFVGGGTPTSLNPAQLERLCSIITKHLPFSPDAEFTFEANPGDLSIEKYRVLKEAGVNRLSFGVQTFDDELLALIGRTHRAKEVFESVETAKKVGFENISVDLMYSLPSQTTESFKRTLEHAFSLDIQHFSGYSLIIEPKTVFYNLSKKGKLPLPGEDTEADMYHMLMDEMHRHGFRQYEISNFAKPGYESRHNLTYWNNEEYFGFGAGAHSYVRGARISNVGPLKKYLNLIQTEQLPIFEQHVVTESEMKEEHMFLGLRKTSGINRNTFRLKYGIDPVALFKQEITDLLERELIKVTEDRVSLTRKGLFLGNEVFQTFIGVI